MTDAEIKKALECCADEMGCAKGCPFFDKKKSKCKVASPYGAFEKLLLDLLNHQQAEIERLESKVEELSEVLSNSIRIRYSEAKSEAIEEFWSRLQGIAYRSEVEWSHGEHPMLIELDDAEEIYEEMVGDAE